jgi:hypothetical protein
VVDSAQNIRRSPLGSGASTAIGIGSEMNTS